MGLDKERVMSEILYEMGEGCEDVAWKVVFGLKKEECV